MTARRVKRPLVRSFTARFRREAAAHVRAGGHAVVWEANPRRATLVIPLPDDHDVMDLGAWSVLDLGKIRYTKEKSGVFRGLATTKVPRGCFTIVKDRAERDSVFPGATRTMQIDCLACGACCVDNKVILYDVDIKRFKDGGRADLCRPPYMEKKGGQRLLKLLPNKRCQHLGRGNLCGIYAVRPDSCSTFPMASEGCLFSRQDALGIVDGVKIIADAR